MSLSPKNRLDQIEGALKRALRTVADVRMTPDSAPGAGISGSARLIEITAELAVNCSELLGDFGRRRKSQMEAML